MTTPRFRSIVPLVCLLLVVGHLEGCADGDSTEIVRVSLKNAETYAYPTHVGDEEGAIISTQPDHYTISEIRRDAGTRWDAVYFYQPAASYVGSDRAEIKIFTGSDGASPNTRVKTVLFYFEIHN